MEYRTDYIYIMVATTIFLMLYYIIKIKCVKRLTGFIVFSHCCLLFFSVYPIISTKTWNDSFWIGCVVGELVLLLFTFTRYRLDLKGLGVYEILNRNQMITLSGPYSKFKPVEIGEISEKIESLFVINEKYRVPYNIVFINPYDKFKEKIEFTFIFWNAVDYNNFIVSNENLIIGECGKGRNAIYLTTSISIKSYSD